jgi:MFS family permease
MRAIPGTSLLREPDFRRFWLAGVVSALGSGVTALALPLTAVLLLGAGAMEMGVLRASATFPVLLLALVAGVWVDRLPRRPIMVGADLGRGALLAVVPLAAAVGALRIELLWAVAFAVGVLTVVFDLAATSYPPTLVPRGRLVDANATLQAGGHAVGALGPGAAGWLVQVVGAPFVVALDALSFVVSAVLLAGIRAPEGAPRPARAGLRREIGEGVGAVWHDPVLRAMIAATTVGSGGGAVFAAVFVLYAVQEIGADPAALGLIFAGSSLAGLAGAALAGRLAARLGVGGALVAGGALIVSGFVLVLFVPPGPVGVVALGACQLLFGFGMSAYSVTQISLRQAITPAHLLGRVNATRRVTVFGIQPVGALVGGALGEAAGLYAPLVLAAALQVVSLAMVLASPLRTAGDTPETAPRPVG